MNRIKEILKTLYNEPLTLFFVLILLTSFIWHEANRNNHFQECDSAGVYNMLYDFPHNAIVYTALTYPEGHILTPATTQKILQNPTASKIIQKYFSKYPTSQIVQRVSTLNLFALVRYGYIQAVSMAHLPHQLQTFFSLPLSSTYSAGPGLLYGLITTSHTSYESFMSRTMFLDLLVFHLAVLLLYLLCRKLKINNAVAIICSLLFLFSLSLYSQGYHLGSTLWNFASEILLLYITASFWQKPNFLKTVSYWAAVLVFFNYLIIFLWLAILLVVYFQNFNFKQLSIKNIWQKAWPIIKSQKVALIFIFICGVLFFQPGQSSRGSSSWHTLPSDLYYIVLNFFSFYNHSHFWQVLQFIFGIILIAITTFYLYKKFNEENPEKLAIKKVLAVFFTIFWVLILLKILNLVPTRHILFLSPVWFLGFALALSALCKNKFSALLYIPIIILVCLAGAYSVKVSAQDSYDLTKQIVLTSDLAEAGVYDCSYNLVNKNWQSTVPVVFINPNQFEAGKNYLYLSQTAPFNTAFAQWQQNYNILIQILSEKDINNQTYFIAYNPDFRRLAYSRPNSLYETKFKVISISKKP